VADVLNKNIRRTDLLARWSEDTLVLLFTETKLAASKKALQKLLTQCEQDQEESSLSWTLSWSCANIQKDEVDKTVEAALARLQPWQDTQPGLLTEEGEGDGGKPKKKLGKYGVRDILSFNHKGKNHF
jgi:GGDEF domain-containing protein